jgi:hypothetical protein
MIDTCKTCRFWADLEGGEGLCRRYAPRPATQKPHSELAWWPHTAAEEWCGEHSAGPSKDPWDGVII